MMLRPRIGQDLQVGALDVAGMGLRDITKRSSPRDWYCCRRTFVATRQAEGCDCSDDTENILTENCGDLPQRCVGSQ